MFGKSKKVTNTESTSENVSAAQTEVAQAQTPQPENVTCSEKYKNIDWRKVSQEKVFGVMAEVMLENKRLNQEINRLNSEIEQNYAHSYETKDKSKETLEDLAQRIAPSLVNEINSGKKYSVIEMKEYIVSDVLKTKAANMRKILELTEKIKSQKELLDELHIQYYNLIEKTNNMPQTEKQQPEAKPSEQKAFTESEFKKMAISSLPDSPHEQKIIMKAIPLEKARNLFMQEDSQIICKVLGEEGLSEFPAIQMRVRQDGISSYRFETVISNLEKEGIIDIERVDTFERNAGLRLVKLKEDIGVVLFKEVFKKEPVKPEMQIIREENDNYRHGYSIKDTLNVLKTNYGYEDVSMSRDTNTITVANRTTWVPDIIGINPLSKKKEYFEVEMATSNDQAFAYKLDKALLVTSELKIITDNKPHAEKILGQVRTWYNSKKTKPNMLVKVYTYVEFKRKEEVGRFWPQQVEENVKIDEIMDKKPKDDTPNKNNKPYRNNDKPVNSKPEKTKEEPVKENPKSDVSMEDDV